jgi:hypothetical protein
MATEARSLLRTPGPAGSHLLRLLTALEEMARLPLREGPEHVQARVQEQSELRCGKGVFSSQRHSREAGPGDEERAD